MSQQPAHPSRPSHPSHSADWADWADWAGTPPPDTSVKVPHLVLALLFLGAAGAWALVEAGVVTADRLTLLGPALLIGAGVVGLAASLAGNRNRQLRSARRTHPAAHDAPHDPHDPFDETHDDRTTTDQTTTDPTQEIR